MRVAAKRRLSVHAVKAGLRDVGELVERLKKASGKLGVFAQAFNPERVVSERHLLHAHALALKAFNEKENYAKTVEIEVLVKAAAETRVNEAIRKVGVKDAGNFLLLTDADGKKLESLLKQVNGRASKPAFKHDIEMAEREFGVSRDMLKNYSLEELVLEAVALSGHEN